MPGIKKKWIKASHKDEGVSEKTTEEEQAGQPEEQDEPKKGQEKRTKSTEAPRGMLKGLDGEVLAEKRKRFVPTAELKLVEWLDSNVESRTEECLPLHQLYTYYTDLCQGQHWDVLDLPEFKKVIKTKYGKSMGLTESSVLKGLIKERKLNKEKKKVLHGVRMKDAVHEAIKHYGNPTQGVRFWSLKQFIGTKYPAFQVDVKRKMLKRSLEMGVGYGQLELVKGIGMAGFYKLTGTEESSQKQTKAKEKENGKKGEDNGEKSKEEGEDSKEEGEEDGEKSQEDKENKEEGGEEKKKEKKPVKYRPVEYSSLCHENPVQIEDTFPLAITYQSAPKVAGLPKIRKYIAARYGEEVTENRWRQVIERGIQSGSWEQVSGSGLGGSIHLLMDDFNPNSSQIEDQVCAAVIACHEPKSASANQIKKYVTKYHPDFKVDQKPDRFKKALLRAVSKQLIVQVSGLGANGSYQLTSHFTPSPAILAGDVESEEEGDSDYSVEKPAYVPRGTKSRGKPKAKASTERPVKAEPPKSHGRPVKRKAPQEAKVTPAKKGRGRSAKDKKRDLSPLTDEEEEEEEEQVEYTPKKSKSRGGGGKRQSSQATPSPRKSPKKKAASKSKSKDESDADDEDDFVPEYTPQKSRSRGGGQDGGGGASPKKSGRSGKRGRK